MHKKVKAKGQFFDKDKKFKTEFGEEDIIEYQKRDKQYDRDEENPSF